MDRVKVEVVKIDPVEYVNSMNEFVQKLNNVEYEQCIDRMRLSVPVVALQIDADLVVVKTTVD